MRYRTLGRTELPVSILGFGCWAIGGTSYGPTRDEESLEALEIAWEHGVNFYDTADTYGHGHSETLIAKFLQGKPRDKVILASKVGWDFYHEGGGRKNFNTDYIRFACEESLKRLQIEALDLYQLHNPSLELIEKGEIIGALAELKKQGKIRFIGISIHKEEEALAAIRDGRVDTLQLVFNLLNQHMAENVFKEAQDHRVGLIVREPLANGLLTGKYSASHQFSKDDHRRRWVAEKRELDDQKIAMLKKVLATNRLSMARAALEYVLEFESISTVIPGMKTKTQVLENLLAVEDPQLRIQESSHLRDLYSREEIFQKMV